MLLIPLCQPLYYLRLLPAAFLLVSISFLWGEGVKYGQSRRPIYNTLELPRKYPGSHVEYQIRVLHIGGWGGEEFHPLEVLLCLITCVEQIQSHQERLVYFGVCHEWLGFCVSCLTKKNVHENMVLDWLSESHFVVHLHSTFGISVACTDPLVQVDIQKQFIHLHQARVIKTPQNMIVTEIGQVTFL